MPLIIGIAKGPSATLACPPNPDTDVRLRKKMVGGARDQRGPGGSASACGAALLLGSRTLLGWMVKRRAGAERFKTLPEVRRISMEPDPPRLVVPRIPSPTHTRRGHPLGEPVVSNYPMLSSNAIVGRARMRIDRDVSSTAPHPKGLR